MKRRLLIAMLCALTLTTTTAAAAATHYELVGDVTWTSVSGETGIYSGIIGSDSDLTAIFAITWWEAWDDPCKFMAYRRNLDNANDVKKPVRDFCDGSTPGNDKTVLRQGPNEYITAIQICRNDKNDDEKESIKGLKVWGRTLDKSSGTLGAETGPDVETHTHCEKWENKVSCPAGQVAAKVKVYWSDGARGISLGCREIGN